MFVIAALHARATLAEAPSSAWSGPYAEEARTLVSVKIAGAPTAVLPLLEVLRERVASGRGAAGEDTSFELIGRVDRASVVTPGPPSPRQLARVWIDLGREQSEHASDPVTIYVVDGPWERVLVRQVGHHENIEITWEEIGHIVESALVALRAGERIGVGRALAQEQLLPVSSVAPLPPPPPDPLGEEPAPPATPASGPPWGIRAGAFYTASAYGYGAGPRVASGAGGLIDVHATSRSLRFSATIMGEYRLPSTVDRGAAVVHLEGGALHVLASASYSPAPRHQVHVGAGPGFELVQAGGIAPGRDDIRFAERTLDTIPTGRLLARYAYAVGPARAFGGAGLDLSLRTLRYTLARADGTSLVVFEPWVARPFLLIGVETN